MLTLAVPRNPSELQNRREPDFISESSSRRVNTRSVGSRCLHHWFNDFFFSFFTKPLNNDFTVISETQSRVVAVNNAHAVLCVYSVRKINTVDLFIHGL